MSLCALKMFLRTCAPCSPFSVSAGEETSANALCWRDSYDQVLIFAALLTPSGMGFPARVGAVGWAFRDWRWESGE